jgi:LPXTG-motif cell wall-anchored protein
MEERKFMSRLKAFALASCVGLLSTSLYADTWNKRTILTVNEAIQVPNKVLQPGKYVMKLLDSQSNRHIVQIFNETEQQLITTILAIPNYRLQPTGDTQFGFWETPAGQPKALRSWFYPGDNFGQEFAYPKNEAMQIAAAVNQPVPTTYAQSEADLTTARVGTVDQAGKEAEMPTGTMAQATPRPATPEADRAATPPPAPEATPQPATPAATPAATPQALPSTGSPYPFIALAGLIALAGYGVLTIASKRA